MLIDLMFLDVTLRFFIQALKYSRKMSQQSGQTKLYVLLEDFL